MRDRFGELVKRTSIALLLLSILGAISGYLRELSMAMTYGAGRLTDAYFVAASIPLVIGDLIIGSVLTACIVPVFSQLRSNENSSKSVSSFLNAILLLVIGLGVLIAVVVTMTMPSLIDLLVPGFDREGRALLAHYAYWLIWLLPLNGAILLINLVLNSYRVFLQPAFTWLAVNLIFFVVIMLGSNYFGRDALIWAAMSGPILLLVINLWRLHKERLLNIEAPMFNTPELGMAAKLARPVLLTFGVGSGLGLLMISHVILRTYGSNLGDGAISALGYAFRIYEVPISLITSSVGVLILPIFSTLFHQQDKGQLTHLSRNLVGWGLLLLLPLSLVVFALAEPLVQLLFHGGAFKEQDVLLTSQALKGFAPAIIFETVFMIFFRMFYGMHRPGFTVTIGIVTLVALFLILESFGKPHSLPDLAISLGSAFAVAAILCIAGMVYLLGRSILPERNETIVLTCLLAIGVWMLLGLERWDNAPLGDRLLGVTGFGLFYAGTVWRFLPSRRATLRSLLQDARAQVILKGIWK